LKLYALNVRARRDLQRIAAGIAVDSWNVAQRVLGEFTEKFEFLGRNPYGGRSREELAPGLRSFGLYEYLIFYRVAKPGIRIVRVVHGRRDLHSLIH
jgi:toxin ParE1/3/4